MIVDTLDNAARYFMLHPSLEQAFDFLEEVNAENFPEGKQEIVGEHLFANGMKRSTKDYDDCIWEAHEQYLDIHFLAEGEVPMKRYMGWFLLTYNFPSAALKNFGGCFSCS